MRVGGAREALRAAALTSAVARRTGSDLDEAAEVVTDGLTRRRLLQGAGIAAAATALPVPLAERALAAPAGKTQPTVVVIGAGAAGLGCADRLWRRYGIKAEVYEYAAQPGGRIRTLRGHFKDQQLVEEHAEFINPEHTVTLGLARSLGLRLDNTDHYPEPHQDQLSLQFDGQRWSQAALNRDWHQFGWKLFHDAAARAPFPTLHTHSTAAGRRFDHLSVSEWVDAQVPGGLDGDFGRLCVSAVLDEYGGPPHEQSALNLIYLLGGDATTNSGNQPKAAPVLGGGDEKWHVHDGNDQLIDGLLRRLPAGAVHVDEELVAVRRLGHGRYAVTLHHGGAGTRVVPADHVVLALPFTTLRDVDLRHVDIAPVHRRAIAEEPLGSNAKMFLQFDRRVWDEAGQTGNAYCAGVVQGSWDATGYQKGSTGILAALPGGSIGKNWGSRYGLTGYRGSAPAQMVSDYLAQFNAIFPGVKAAYNGRSYYVWSAGDPHIRGAYSYLKVGQYTGFNGVQGRREGNLHFAGEHTSVDYQGYIEGALRSGHRCADEIAGPRPRRALR